MATKSEDLGLLSEVGWLLSQPASFCAWVARAGGWRIYEKDQMLYQCGDDPDGLYGLGSGMLEAQIPIGEEQVTIYRAEPGFWIGDSAILARTSRFISVSAVVKSRVFFIPAAAIKALLREEPEFWYGAVAELVGIEGGVVSGVINLESSGVEASDWRLRHDQAYHEA